MPLPDKEIEMPDSIPVIRSIPPTPRGDRLLCGCDPAGELCPLHAPPEKRIEKGKVRP